MILFWIISQVLMIAANIWMAHYHASIFLKGGTVKHGLWGGAYVLVAGILSWIAGSWCLLLCYFLARKVFFDSFLNKFQKFSIFRVSKETSSILDQMHNWLFKSKSKVYLPLYFLVLIILNLLKFKSWINF